MANEAFYPKTGNKIKIDEINEKNRYDKFLCSGITDEGHKCLAPVYPIGLAGRHPHFKIQELAHHIPGCPNDKSEAHAIIRHLDITGKNTSMEKILFDCSRDNSKISSPDEKEKNLKSDLISPEVEKSTLPRKIVRRSKNASSVRELCAICSLRDIWDTFSDKYINDIIIDHRNVAAYRRNGIPAGNICIILCSKVGLACRAAFVPNPPKDSIILRDAFAFDDRARGLFFLFHGNAAAREKIFSASSKKIIAILAKWNPHPDLKNVFVCSPVHAGQICIFNHSFFES